MSGFPSLINLWIIPNLQVDSWIFIWRAIVQHAPIQERARSAEQGAALNYGGRNKCRKQVERLSAKSSGALVWQASTEGLIPRLAPGESMQALNHHIS